MVSVTAEQCAEIERYIELLMRANLNERAAKMMNLSLAYKFAKSSEPETPSNVVDLHDFSKKVSTTKEVPA